MDGKRSLDEIVAEINNYFEDVPAGALEEISAFISTLAEQGFVGYALTDTHR
jgi:hypothetical protein